MTLVEQYTKMSEEIIQNDEDITKYEHDLEARDEYIKNLNLYASCRDLFTQPVRLLRTKLAKNRIKQIKKSYYKLRNKSLREYVSENDEEFGQDLEDVARYIKPSELLTFANEHKISYENDEKKLIKRRN